MLLTNLFQNPLYVLAFFIAVLFGITVHEFAHAWVAYKSGDSTAKYMGRLTLNPFAHLDPLGTLMLLIIGFGWGKPIPINPHNFNKKSDELKVAFAGIVVNILVALILAIPIRLALLHGIAIESSAGLSFLNFVVEINLILAAFNLLPIFPLDGSHLVEYFLSESAREEFQTVGPYILFGLVALNYITNISIFSYLMEPILRLLSLLTKGTFRTY